MRSRSSQERKPPNQAGGADARAAPLTGNSVGRKWGTKDVDENRAQALQRLMGELDRFELFSPPHNTSIGVTSDAGTLLRPFLENPDRHARHVAVIIEYVQLMATAAAFRPFLGFYKLPFLRGWATKYFSFNVVRPLKARIEEARDDALATVEPGELRVDLLPVASVATKPAWKGQARRLVLIELRGVAIPAAGMQLRALSHEINLTHPPGCQFVDAIPSNEMEALGEREVSISERGKFVLATAESAKVSGSLSRGPIEVGGSYESTSTSSKEAESSTSEKLSHAPQVARVISSAVGNVAMWRLLRTPSQLLLGTNKFSATALVPHDAKKLSMTVMFGADIDGWGPTSMKREFDVPIPRATE